MKKYLKVLAYYERDGSFTPKVIIWDERSNYYIDQVTDIHYTTSPMDLNPGICFTCLIHGKKRYIFFEEKRWYVMINKKPAKPSPAG